MELQTTFDLNTRAYVSRLVREGDVALLCRVLKGRGWMSAAQIADAVHPWHERKIRAVASFSSGEVLSGQQGYKLTVECTPEEALHAASWLRNQAREMIRRSIRIQRVFHNAASRQRPEAREQMSEGSLS